MSRYVGTTSRGIRCPIIKEGDHLEEIVTESVLQAAQGEGFLQMEEALLRKGLQGELQDPQYGNP